MDFGGSSRIFNGFQRFRNDFGWILVVRARFLMGLKAILNVFRRFSSVFGVILEDSARFVVFRASLNGFRGSARDVRWISSLGLYQNTLSTQLIFINDVSTSAFCSFRIETDTVCKKILRNETIPIVSEHLIKSSKNKNASYLVLIPQDSYYLSIYNKIHSQRKRK